MKALHKQHGGGIRFVHFAKIRVMAGSLTRGTALWTSSREVI